ncbi:hypothetical protein BRADI_4g29766v3 [Brachypodium distachyon]|uniref:Uncharacterized protein n=1 Tax=Brachypodium distachyon TaxID=15368 RepID=A0A2K2CR71_BRADI|nr:hypothetical protein BRADI_4g29766v3 [Brachypodium distachyon]
MWRSLSDGAQPFGVRQWQKQGKGGRESALCVDKTRPAPPMQVDWVARQPTHTPLPGRARGSLAPAQPAPAPAAAPGRARVSPDPAQRTPAAAPSPDPAQLSLAPAPAAAPSPAPAAAPAAALHPDSAAAALHDELVDGLHHKAALPFSSDDQQQQPDPHCSPLASSGVVSIFSFIINRLPPCSSEHERLLYRTHAPAPPRLLKPEIPADQNVTPQPQISTRRLPSSSFCTAAPLPHALAYAQRHSTTVGRRRLFPVNRTPLTKTSRQEQRVDARKPPCQPASRTVTVQDEFRLS